MQWKRKRVWWSDGEKKKNTGTRTQRGKLFRMTFDTATMAGWKSGRVGHDSRAYIGKTNTTRRNTSNVRFNAVVNRCCKTVFATFYTREYRLRRSRKFSRDDFGDDVWRIPAGTHGSVTSVEEIPARACAHRFLQIVPRAYRLSGASWADSVVARSFRRVFCI